MAFCDGSTVRDADLVETDHVRRHYIGSNLYAMFNADTRWHYLSRQSPDEVILMKMFDSDRKVKAKCEFLTTNQTYMASNWTKTVHTLHLSFRELKQRYSQERASKSGLWSSRPPLNDMTHGEDLWPTIMCLQLKNDRSICFGSFACIHDAGAITIVSGHSQSVACGMHPWLSPRFLGSGRLTARNFPAVSTVAWSQDKS